MIESIGHKTPNVDETAFVHSSAVVCGEVCLAAQVSVWPCAVLRGDIAPIRIGAGSNVQDNACLHIARDIPLEVGERVTIGHGAILHSCTVEDEALIGMGAIVLDNARIGKGAMIGAGALVPPGMQVEPGMLVVGVPGKAVRPLKPQELQANLENAQEYIQLGKIMNLGE